MQAFAEALLFAGSHQVSFFLSFLVQVLTKTFFTENLFPPGWEETVAQVHLIRDMTLLIPVKKVSGMRIDRAVLLIPMAQLELFCWVVGRDVKRRI